ASKQNGRQSISYDQTSNEVRSVHIRLKTCASTSKSAIASDKQRFEMTVVKVLGHVFRNHRFALLQQLQIPLAQFRRNLVGDVQQLSNVRVEILAFGIMAQRRNDLLGVPAVDGFFRGQLPAIDVN